jgi:hypothetical protein
MSSCQTPFVRPVQRESVRQPVESVRDPFFTGKTRAPDGARRGSSAPPGAAIASPDRTRKKKSFPERVGRPRPEKLSAREDLVP